MIKKLFIILIVIVSIGNQSKAQTWQWAKSGNGTSLDEGNAVATDKSGNVFITGYFQSPTLTFGTYTLTNAGSGDVYIAKYDANGNVLWAKRAGGSVGDEGNAVCADATGNVFLTGYFQSPTITFGTYTLTNAGTNPNIFIAKYDPNGNVLWAKHAGGTGDDEGISVSSDVAGNVFVTGWFFSPTITFGTYTLTNVDTVDVFIVKYDANGNVLWAKSGGGHAQVEGGSVSTDAAGDVFLTGGFLGHTLTFDTYTLASAGSADVFIAKYDANGNVLWAKRAGGTGDEGGCSASTDVSGNVFITGQFQSSTLSFGTYTLTNIGTDENVFIAKYDANGNVLWAKSVGAPGAISGVGAIGYAVSADTIGNAYITGGFSSPTIIFDTYTLTAPLPLGSTDPMFVVKYDANGNVLCASSLASGGDDQNGVSADRFGNAYITGDFAVNPFILGSNTLTLTGGENIFVAKWEANCSRASIEQITNSNEVSIYPNPASSSLQVTFAGNIQNTIIEVYNTIGECVYRQTIQPTPSPSKEGTSAAIDVSNLAEGVYNISIISSVGVVNKRLVIVR
ncbi:MAG TPA: T9SS type A sorting domain-containing protein [Bacteroidia bacterium]